MNKYDKDWIDITSGADVRKCMRCGKCTATCPSFNEMEYHPHQFVYMIEKGDIEPLLNSESLYKCLTCFACVDRCPRGVEPARLIEAVRLMAVRKQGGNRLNAEKVSQIADDTVPQQLLVSAYRKYSK